MKLSSIEARDFGLRLACQPNCPNRGRRPQGYSCVVVLNYYKNLPYGGQTD